MDYPCWWPPVTVGAGKGELVTWSGFHSKLQEVGSVKPPAEIDILPLFSDKSTDPGIIKDAMLIVKKSIAFLNPGQTPVLGADQPLYAIAKQLQWQFPDILGEDVYVLMMGTLHIEDKGNLCLESSSVDQDGGDDYRRGVHSR